MPPPRKDVHKKAKHGTKTKDASPATGTQSTDAPPRWRAEVQRMVLMGLFGFVLAGTYSLGSNLLRDDDMICHIQDMLGLAEPLADAAAVTHPEGVAVGTTAHNDTMLWGTYRPQAYFGLRTREEKSFLFGLGWGIPGDMRYTAEDDQDVTFGWKMHNGVHSGIQLIRDKKNGILLTTTFIKDTSRGLGGSRGGWTARIKGTRIPGKRQWKNGGITIAPIFASELADSLSFEDVEGGEPRAVVKSSTPLAGRFRVTVSASKGADSSAKAWDSRTNSAAAGDEWRVVWYNFQKTRKLVGGEMKTFPPVDHMNQLMLSQTFKGDFTIEITLVPERAAHSPLTGCYYARQLVQHDMAFNTRFGDVFGRHPNDVEKFALSNMIGGIGYWHGSAVREKGGIIPSHELFSGVPSRAKFPRGFLWDEGFHQLLIGKWNPELSKDIITSWASQMEPDGWIAREQIRGPEPRSRVPDQFVPQSSSIANPPTLLLQLQNFALAASESTDPDEAEHLAAFSKRIYPYMKRWHQWFKTTQAGDTPHTFRWRGKDGYHLLSCGLDDYPRSRCNTEAEKHVDLLSWMILMTETMRSLAALLGEQADVDSLTAERTALRAALMEHHWNAPKQTFADASGCPAKPEGEKQPPKHPPHFGYVNLFPLLCGALDPEADKDKVLAIVRRTREELLSDFGIRSLSERSLRWWPRHDNYWTGPIWINLNYMFSRALTRYGYAQIHPEVEEFRTALNQRVTRLINEEYKRTGKIWENYNATSGHGRGTAPFTGWTSLFILMQ
eukprot:TRINITY_DN1252_c0_g3_i1.p1 TRINITY_DN1252_c0_g3~~TRINITY_DN1252_c0_g3_i1.p1  ORF type:complete len:837 (+),score=274.38 TRINITY_DN1252_c0_g3_i1:174-2513(+)